MAAGRWWSVGGALVERWFLCAGGALVERWRGVGGALAVRWWSAGFRAPAGRWWSVGGALVERIESHYTSDLSH